MKTIGVIGLGSIGMRHAKNLKAMGHQILAYDPNINSIPHPHMSNETLENLIENSEAVVIASPTPRHYFDITETIGTPTFIEKPIADRLPDFPHTYHQIKMVGYNLRFHSCVKKAKEWLDSGKIGDQLWAQFVLGQHSTKPPYLRDGVILNWSHEIDLAIYLLGDAVVAGSNTALMNNRDYMTDILLTHENCRSTIHLDYITSPEQRYFKIVGTEGTIYVNVADRFAHLHHYPDAANETFHGKDTWNDNYIEEMQAFLDRCDGKETIGCTGEEGLKVLEICLEVRRWVGLA